MKTPTSKKSSAAERKQWLRWEDGMLQHCRALITLAGLLTQSGEDGLSAELVGDTGALMVREAQQLKKLVSARPGNGGPR